MNRVVHAHLKSITPENPCPDPPVFFGGEGHPNAREPSLCELDGMRPRLDVETGKEELWELKNLRKASTTYDDERVPESSIEILGQSVGGITDRQNDHRAQDDHDPPSADRIPGSGEKVRW